MGPPIFWLLWYVHCLYNIVVQTSAFMLFLYTYLRFLFLFIILSDFFGGGVVLIEYWWKMFDLRWKRSSDDHNLLSKVNQKHSPTRFREVRINGKLVIMRNIKGVGNMVFLDDWFKMGSQTLLEAWNIIMQKILILW